MIVTARSVPTRDGRQMCSSTPRVLTFCSRSFLPTRALAPRFAAWWCYFGPTGPVQHPSNARSRRSTTEVLRLLPPETCSHRSVSRRPGPSLRRTEAPRPMPLHRHVRPGSDGLGRPESPLRERAVVAAPPNGTVQQRDTLFQGNVSVYLPVGIGNPPWTRLEVCAHWHCPHQRDVRHTMAAQASPLPSGRRDCP